MSRLKDEVEIKLLVGCSPSEIDRVQAFFSQQKRALAMKKNLVALVVVGVVLLVADLCYAAAPRTAPFRVRVVDERTGRGVSNARVTVENGQQDTTAFDGPVLFWLDTSMMDRTVRFSIERRGVTTTSEVSVTGGGLAVPVPSP